ncbi:MAG: DUF6290 family protein [Defluviitaleaceae bacterium]|nr:DUF6290 family protein [Defluviitaleaceae bacterium]
MSEVFVKLTTEEAAHFEQYAKKREMPFTLCQAIKFTSLEMVEQDEKDLAYIQEYHRELAEGRRESRPFQEVMREMELEDGV